MYSVLMPSIAVSAAQDLITITAGTNNSLVVHSAVFSQSSDYGDAAAEGLRFIIKQGSTVGSGGTTQTPAAIDAGLGASDASARKNDTTAATGGTNVYEENANIQAGWFYRPTPEERITIAGGTLVVFNLPTAPTDALTMSGTVLFEELG
jgi:hypothetical protein